MNSSVSIYGATRDSCISGRPGRMPIAECDPTYVFSDHDITVMDYQSENISIKACKSRLENVLLYDCRIDRIIFSSI